MHCVSSDDVTISHWGQPAEKATVIIDDCQHLPLLKKNSGFWELF